MRVAIYKTKTDKKLYYIERIFPNAFVEMFEYSKNDDLSYLGYRRSWTVPCSKFEDILSIVGYADILENKFEKITSDKKLGKILNKFENITMCSIKDGVSKTEMLDMLDCLKSEICADSVGD